MFNKISRIFFAATTLALVMVACKKEVNEEIITPRTEVKFATSDTGRIDMPRVYYVADNPNSMFSIPVGFTTISDQDRTINIVYTSPTGAAQGVQYTAATTVTIPAGQASDSVELRGLFAGYAGNRIDTIKVTLSSPDAPLALYSKTMTLVLRPYCDVVLGDLMGDYVANEYSSSGTFSWGPYTATVTNLVSTGPTSATGEIINLWDAGWNNITVNFDWANPAAFKVEIPMQPTGNGTITTGSKGGNFSSCDRAITLYANVVDGGSTYTNYEFRLR